MRFLSKAPDGGPASGVTGYFLIEIKSLFSIVLLKFEEPLFTPERFHSHAFNAVTMWLKGKVSERTYPNQWRRFRTGNVKYTPRQQIHQIYPTGTAWALTFRGPWHDTWQEIRDSKVVTLTHGRREL